MTTCACGFSISGYGTPYFTTLLEQGILRHVGEVDLEGLKEIARGFVFSIRGSKTFLQMLLPRFRLQLQDFTTNELCYMLYAYNDVGYLPKSFTKEVEERVFTKLIKTEEISPQEIALITKVFCKTRTGSRDFHKLLETTILMRMGDLKEDMKILHSIGASFEESGLCSLDTLKALKKQVFQSEVENEVFE